MFTQTSSPIDNFLEFLKQETGKDVKECDAIFHRDYAHYRHMPYPDTNADVLPCGNIEPTWINIILHSRLTDQQRSAISPRRFDLLNKNITNDDSMTISELITDLSVTFSDRRGEKLEEKETKSILYTVLKGLRQTIGNNFSDSSQSYPVTTLKLISLFYKISRERSNTIFQFIKSPFETRKYSLELGNNTPDPRGNVNSLIIADLISYLSVLMPIDRLHRITQVNLDTHDFWNAISEHSLTTAKMIRLANNGNDNAIYAAYRDMADAIEKYAPDIDVETGTQPAEAMHTYLRVLILQNNIGEYLNIFSDHYVDKKSIKTTTDTIEKMCKVVSEEKNMVICRNDKILSINELQEFVHRHGEEFRKVIAAAKEIYVKNDQLEKITNRAIIILLLYIFNTYKTTDINKPLISISDIVAALYTIGIQMKEGKDYLPYSFGQNARGTNPLRYIDNVMDIDQLIQMDNQIPQGVKHLMYRKFCQIHSYMTGNAVGHDSFTSFENAKLKKILECINSNNAEKIDKNIDCFLSYCKSIEISMMIPSMTTSMTRTLQQWANQGAHKS